MANTKDNVKSEHIRVYVEETVFDTFRMLCEKDGVSMSVAARKLILKELLTRGVMPNETLLRLVLE